jgi:fructose/tagatose bisphosphate aldolase
VKIYNEDAQHFPVFHGASGPTRSEIREALDCRVVKMTVDIDMQYVFTRAIAGHICELEGKRCWRRECMMHDTP